MTRQAVGTLLPVKMLPAPKPPANLAGSLFALRGALSFHYRYRFHREVLPLPLLFTSSMDWSGLNHVDAMKRIGDRTE
jgi:hypothetical protein